jgi:tetratricopeptide (TPR) repeat protein
MILRRPSIFALAAAGLAFAAALIVAVAVQRGGAAPPVVAQAPTLLPGASTDQRIATLQTIVRDRPRDVRGYAALGAAYLQKVRETGDASYYPRAGGLVRRGLRLGPHDSDMLTVAGTLALARHDFRGGLALGRAAHRANPVSAAPYPVLVDALVELGRYPEADRTLQRLVDLKPTLAAYARVSYLRELHGDLAGAVSAIRLAASAGGGVPENVAFVQTILGGLELTRGRLGAARHAYAEALARFPGYPAADAGLAKVDAAEARLGLAIRRLRGVVARLPLPEYVVALGEDELAAGRPAAARRDLALVRVEERLLAANGVNTDVDLALFEASHGSPARGVALARRAWAQAPSVRSADALGWALTRAGRPAEGLRWSRQALRLGSRDALFLLHAGLAARGADRRRYLTRSLADHPSPYWARIAREALR